MFHVKRLFFLVFLLPFVSYGQHIGSSVLPVKPMPKLPFKNSTIDQYLESNSEYKLLGPAEKEWYYWTNYSRNNPKAFWDSIVSPILTNYPSLQNSYTISLKKD